MSNPTYAQYTFRQLVEVQDKQNPDTREEEWHERRILCFDPGKTTGWALFENKGLVASGQILTPTVEAATAEVKHLLYKYAPDQIVYEDYRVYKQHKDRHVGSEMTTTRIIGCIETLAAMSFIPIHKQMASTAKVFCTDEKLRHWGFYKAGLRHARDAIRHGCFYILFYHQVKGDHSNKTNTVG